MKKIILLWGFVILSSPLFANDFQLLNSGTTLYLQGICFVNDNTGYVVGNGGTMIKTTNAGASWFNLNINVGAIGIMSVHFTSPLIGYILGYGTFITTADGGNSWTIITLEPNIMRDVCFADNATGYIVGDNSLCLKTVNGGTIWTPQDVPISSATLNSVIFNYGKGFICAANSVTNLLTTTNGGTNWVDSKIRTGTLNGRNISFRNNFGVCVGHELIWPNIKPTLFTTTNNGNNWFEYVFTNRYGKLMSSAISATDSNKFYVVGNYAADSNYSNKGMILYTTNGGANFNEDLWPTNDVVFNGVAITSNAVYVVGSYGIILKKSNPTSINPVSTEIPSAYSLSQNYPNPFNPSTVVRFSLSVVSNVCLVLK